MASAKSATGTRAAAGQQNKDIAAMLSMTPKKVARWRLRFLALGVAGLQKDLPRSGRKPTISARLTQRVVTMTTRQQPSNATHWSTRTMAAAVGISPASVRRIWHAHGLKPHRVETFKISNDPAFAEKLEDIVGLNLNLSQLAWPGGYNSDLAILSARAIFQQLSELSVHNWAFFLSELQDHQQARQFAIRRRQGRPTMLILIIILILVFGLGGGYYGHTRWGPGGGAGIGLGTILLILVIAYMLGLFRW
jgi:transposase